MTVSLILFPPRRFINSGVTWNNMHLTYLMRRDTPEGVEFCGRFPSLRIVDPPTFLDEIHRSSVT